MTTSEFDTNLALADELLRPLKSQPLPPFSRYQSLLQYPH